ncbi:hypothetical protein [Corallococcus aberystwythensis]|uniref:hypothetical protein n=1 Tax=Corallococcus aberystwythensis TaxID=2316722 RepID=UPI001315831E|nr:hypothetical protein [Corallococcus aberystwythensis]
MEALVRRGLSRRHMLGGIAHALLGACGRQGGPHPGVQDFFRPVWTGGVNRGLGSEPT